MKYHDSCPACRSKHVYQIEEIDTQDVLDAMKIPANIFSQTMNDEKSESIPTTIFLYRCKCCDLEFANPMFVASGNFYAYMQKDANYYNDRWEFHRTLKYLPANCNILDIGCGEGSFLELATLKGHNIIGIDFNQTALKIARSKGLTVYDYDLKELSKNIVDNLDTAVFFHVIEHLDNLDQFFHDLADLLPIGSSLYFSCPSPTRYSQYLEPDLLVGQKEFWDYPPHHQTRWNQQSINHLLQRMGWQLLKIETEPFDWRGIATKLANDHLRSKNLDMTNLSSMRRKLSILLTMIQTAVPAMRYSGLSMLCQAKRIRDI